MKIGKKASGGRYRKARKKKKQEIFKHSVNPKMGTDKKKKVRTSGGNEKRVLLSGENVNLINKKTKKSSKGKIKNVLETPSNHFLARQNILMKGAIIETDKGKAKITNRPSQEGNIQAVLVE